MFTKHAFCTPEAEAVQTLRRCSIPSWVFGGEMFAKSLQATESGAQLLHIHDELSVGQDSGHWQSRYSTKKCLSSIVAEHNM